jgi:hypothetical protein
MKSISKLPFAIPFITRETLLVLYPQLASLLDKIPSQVEDGLCKYNALAALDVVNGLRNTRDAEPLEITTDS